MSVNITFKANFKDKKFNFNGKLNFYGYKIKDEFLQEYQYGIKTGKKYGSHIASNSDETPARISGKLGNSLHCRVAKNTLTISDTSGYGKFLEFGTKHIEKREGVLKAIIKNQKGFENDISRNI